MTQRIHTDLKQSYEHPQLVKLTQLSQNPQIIKIQEILEEKLGTTLIRMEPSDTTIFNQMKKSIQNFEIFNHSAEILKGYSTNDENYPSFLTRLCQLITETAFSLAKNIEIRDDFKRGIRYYHGMVTFKSQNLVEMSIQCQNKTLFKKSIAFHLLKTLYPTALIIISAKILKSEKDFIENWEKSQKIKKISDVDLSKNSSTEMNDYDRILISKSPLDARILHLKNFVDHDMEAEQQKRALKETQRELLAEKYSIASSICHQKIQGRSLSLEVKVENIGKYLITGKSQNEKTVFKILMTCKNKKIAKNVGGLIYFKLYYSSIYQWILGQKLGIENLNKKLKQNIKVDEDIKDNMLDLETQSKTESQVLMQFKNSVRGSFISNGDDYELQRLGDLGGGGRFTKKKTSSWAVKGIIFSIEKIS